MKLSDFNTLTEAQAYSETNGKMISPDVMLAFLTKFDHVDILDNPTTKENKALVHAFKFGSEFNLIEGHPLSVTSMLNQMETDGLVSNAFVQHCTDYANPISYPFADTTQEEFNVTMLDGESTATITYSGNDKLVVTGSQYLAFHATLAAPAPRDTKVTVTARTSKGDGVYAKVSKVWKFPIEQGEIGFNDINLPVRGLGKWVQFEAKLDTANMDCTINCVSS